MPNFYYLEGDGKHTVGEDDAVFKPVYIPQSIQSPVDSAAAIGQLVYPRIQAEIDAGIADWDATAAIGDANKVVRPWEPYFSDRRYGSDPTGTVLSTNALQAAANAASHSTAKEVQCENGLIKYDTLYLYHDSVDNPNYLSSTVNRISKISLVGRGQLSNTELKNYPLTILNYGTILESTGAGIIASTASAGSGANHSAPAGTHQPRAFEMKNLTAVANNTGEIVRMEYCPSFRFENVSMVQLNIAGKAIYCRDNWFGQMNNCRIHGQPGSTSVGIDSGVTGNYGGGMFSFDNCVFENWNDLVTWDGGGVWADIHFTACCFQAVNRYGFYSTGGAIRVLTFENNYFESPAAANTCERFVYCANNIDTFVFKHNYMYMGNDAGTSHVSDRAVRLDTVDTICFEDNYFFRPYVDILHVEAVLNGYNVGSFDRNHIIHDNPSVLTAGQVTCVTIGAGNILLPQMLDNIYSTGGGDEPHDVNDKIWLYDYNNELPTVYRDKWTRHQLHRHLSVGEARTLTGVSTTQAITRGDPNLIDITNTGAHDVTLPSPSLCVEGRIHIIRNNPSSTGTITVKTAGGTTLGTLASSGESGLFMYSRTAGNFMMVMKGAIS